MLDEINLKSLLESKIVSIANSFQECNIEPGYYWNILRKNNFFINQAVTHCNDHVFEIMEQRCIKPITDKTCCLCAEEYEEHFLVHLGCSHAFCAECLEECIKA
jgi:hypothetical protein